VTPDESTTEGIGAGYGLAFQGVFDAHPAVLLLVDPRDGRVVDANPAAAAFYGHPRARLSGMAVAELGAIPFPDADDPVPHRLADGRTRHVTIQAGAFAAPTGELVLAIVTDVTENLRDRELARRFTEVIEATTDAVGFVDESRSISYMNRAGLALLGYPEDADPSGIPVQSLRPDWVNELMERVAVPTALREGVWTGEAAVLTRHGEEIPVSQVVLARKDPDGRPLYFATIIRDIRVAKAREQALRESNERYRLLVEQSLAGVYILQDGGFTYVNPRLAAILHRAPEELCDGRSVLSLVAPEDRHRVESHLRTREEGAREADHYEVRFLRPDGSPIHLEVYGRRVDLEGGAAILGLMLDVSPRKRAEADLRLLRRAVEQSPSAVVITERDGTVVYVNSAFERTSGYDREEAIGNNPRLLKSGRHGPKFYRRMWETLLSGRPWTGELQNRRKDGTIFTELATISPVADRDGVITHFVAVKLDVSEQLRLEEQLRHAQKMEAVGRLAGGIAHDFNNILTSITGHARMALDGAPADGEAADDLLALIRDADRATALTRQLLAFSRKQKLSPEVLDVRDVITDLRKLLQRLIGAHITLGMNAWPDPLMVQVDRGQLEQIILNLVVNARDALTDGGRITLEIDQVPEVPESVSRTDQMAAGPAVVLSVSDNGPGIPEEILPRIFEPFFTTKPQGKGTGLGLSTVYGILRQSGGAVDVDSRPGEGTTFRVYLPRAGGGRETETVEPEPRAPEAATGHVVLVAEDEEGVRSLASRVLERAGYSVITAADGLEALERVKKTPGSIDLLFTDMVMPRMGGKELARRLREIQPDLPVVYTSGYTEDHLHPDEDLRDASRFLDKPYPPARLLGAVAEALAD
jgi:two-component system cell cycle sensor histidine kinase/response regulator CckA